MTAVTIAFRRIPIETVEEASGMLISEVLRILDTHEQPQPEPAVPAGESFAALLSVKGRAEYVPAAPEPPHASGLTATIGNTVSTKSAAAQFPLGQRSYDSFLRALKDAKKPRALHRLDLFQ